MAQYSDFSINAILGLKSEPKRSHSCSSSSDLDSDDQEFEPQNPLIEAYFRGLALHQIHVAKLQLSPPAWSQRQQTKKVCNGTRKYSQDQTEVLTLKYSEKRYVNREEMQELSFKTGLSMLQVKIWFQNRRLKERKAIHH